MLVERMQHFVMTVSPAQVPALIGLTQQVDLDASFRLMGICVWNLGVPAGTGCEGQLAIRIYRPDGRQIQRQLTSSNLLTPGNQYNQTSLSPNKALAAPIRPSVLYPAGSVINFDVLGLDTGIASPSGCIIVFIGTNIYQQGNVWNPQYPPKWKPRPYLDNLTIQSLPIPGGLPALSIPFTAQADSDFVWQAGEYTDFSLNATPASLLVHDNDENLLFKLTAVTAGAAGNSISFQVIVAGDNTPFSITVVGSVITATAATGAGGASQSLASFIADLLATPAFNALVTIGPPEGGGAFSFGNVPPTLLSGGSGAGPVATDQLIDLGVIIRDPGYKAYSNGYVPVALLFPFLSSEAPGWLYPEIYIPRLGQIYFDLNYLYPGFTPASPVTITLGLKGMKVYPQSS
jgi:hypothetical protein